MSNASDGPLFRSTPPHPTFVTWLAASLRKGTALGRRAAGTLPIGSGTGFCVGIDPILRPVDFEGDRLTVSSDEADAALAHFLGSSVGGRRFGGFVVENTVEPLDPHGSLPGIEVEGHVVYWMDVAHSWAEAVRLMRVFGMPWQMNCFVLSVSPDSTGLSAGQPVAPSTLDRIVDATEVLVTIAFDGDSFVLWERG